MKQNVCQYIFEELLPSVKYNPNSFLPEKPDKLEFDEGEYSYEKVY